MLEMVNLAINEVLYYVGNFIARLVGTVAVGNLLPFIVLPTVLAVIWVAVIIIRRVIGFN